MGIRSYEVVAPAAKWASAAAVATDILPFTRDENKLLPCMADRNAAHARLTASGVPTTHHARAADIPVDEAESKTARFVNERFKFLPMDPSLISTFYDGQNKLPFLQRMLSRQMESAVVMDFLRSRKCSPSDALRISSCKPRSSSLWL
jgi:hypothetical protein